MSTYLYRWGRWAAGHPWRMIAAWVIIAIAVVGINSALGGDTRDDFTIPGTEAQQGIDLLADRFPSRSGVEGRVVFADPDGDVTDPAARAAIADTLAAFADGPDVVGVTDPFDPRHGAVSPDGSVAFATVRYSVDPPAEEHAEAALEAAEIARAAGLEAELSRLIVVGSEEVEGSEAIGLGVALLVLLVAFGSVIAAGIPIGSALFGIFIGLGLVGTLAGFTDVPSISPMIASMIGIGVGIDYALFVVTRHRSFLERGATPVEAAARANATAGTAVLFAGTTVVVAITGLFIAGIPSIAMMGFASAITVTVAMVAAVTLLPAFLGLVGDRIDRLRVGRRVTAEQQRAHQTFSGRWADHVGRHPWRYAIASFVALVAMAAPVLAMRTGMPDDGTGPADATYRKAYDLLAGGFGPGFNGPLTIVVDGDAATIDVAATTIAETVATTDGVAFVAAPALNAGGDTAVITAIPTTSPQSEATQDLVERLRRDVLPAALVSDPFSSELSSLSDATTEENGEREAAVDVYVTGQTAAFIDISERLADRLPIFLATVIAVSFLLLMVVFRSVLVPLKAAVMNLLSIGAAYGVVVAVFQWGWGNELLGVEQTVPISPFLPMIMFAILFGLSMDYEVFLLSRVREAFVRSGDSHASVVEGLATTARVITSAALIMVSVFAAFLLTPDVEVKMFAVGLAVAIAVDASIVRMVFVPSSMALMGDANWWLPSWLDRILPHVDVEGTAIETTFAPAADGVATGDRPSDRTADERRMDDGRRDDGDHHDDDDDDDGRHRDERELVGAP